LIEKILADFLGCVMIWGILGIVPVSFLSFSVFLSSCKSEKDSAVSNTSSPQTSRQSFELIAQKDTQLKILQPSEFAGEVPLVRNLSPEKKCFIRKNSRIKIKGKPEFVSKHVFVEISEILSHHPQTQTQRKNYS
jgi:hypothetical protein